MVAVTFVAGPATVVIEPGGAGGGIGVGLAVGVGLGAGVGWPTLVVTNTGTVTVLSSGDVIDAHALALVSARKVNGHASCRRPTRHQ